MDGHGAIILIEIVIVFGGALAFGWWQLRDLKRERLRREAAARAAADEAAPAAAPLPSGDAP
jgi:hypothetical protein